MSRLLLTFKAVRQLGPVPSAYYAWYQLGLRSGYLKWKTNQKQTQLSTYKAPDDLRSLLDLPDAERLSAILGDERIAQVIAEADEIVNGKVRLFGSEPVPLQLVNPGHLVHWTQYETGVAGTGDKEGESSEVGVDDHFDVKFIWEPARFGWACTLARAYLLSGDDRYPAAFWSYLETFLDANPPNYGPHWVSAQEVALRIITLTFTAQVFNDSQESTPERKSRLALSVAEHAARIPPTISYARAQNNNHLLSEAAGLYTAGAALPDHPESRRWRDLGWRWFNDGLADQIAGDGTYVQHSTNYQRLALQLALWMRAVALKRGRVLPKKSRQRLGVATRWLLEMCDRESGRVPNLGPNDGSYILPLTVCPFDDYRPVTQAAAKAFLGEYPFDSGAWDETSHWFGINGDEKLDDGTHSVLNSQLPALLDATPHILQSPGGSSWVYLRAAKFTSRPGHADQLHLDLWWRGLNLALDPGTYLYNAPPPWDNSLSRTSVHNTLTVNGLDQMTHAGRFLYLDWAQGQVIDGRRDQTGAWRSLVARHDGYQGIGIIHQRTVTTQDERNWLVEDAVLPADEKGNPETAQYDVRVHWLLPDWNWEIDDTTIRVHSPYGWVTVNTDVQDAGEKKRHPVLQLVRAGEPIHGSGDISHTLGWYSPTYGAKEPALSLGVSVRSELPLSVTTQWIFPNSKVDDS